MARLETILEQENGRTDENKNVIHLYLEGGFYRAYEWSAWLCHRYIKEFKVTHRKFNNVEQTVLFVGFPLTSFDKYAEEMTSVRVINEKEKEFVLSDLNVPDDMDLDMMKTDFGVWKDSIPVQEPNKKKESAEQQNQNALLQKEKEGQYLSMSQIMNSILAFPLESKSPLDCMLFVSQLKGQISRLM